MQTHYQTGLWIRKRLPSVFAGEPNQQDAHAVPEIQSHNRFKMYKNEEFLFK